MSFNRSKFRNDMLAVDRRDFLKTLTAAGVGVAVGGLSWPVEAEVAQPRVAGVRDRYFLRSTAPLTYIRDYSGGHLNNETFIRTIADHAPQLLVVGKDVPIDHNWGPVAGTGGENQRFGQGEAIRRLTPPQLREKMKELRTMTAKLHAVNVRWLLPYIGTMTIGGDPKTRGGLWGFYDHWDDYQGFDLGPKPREDPLQWMQRKANGELQTYYPLDAPYYAPNKRWAACINNPGWRQHLGNVVRLIAEVGYDGVYMDNNRSVRCHCRYCQARFRRYVNARVRPAEIRQDLGVDDLDSLHLATEPVGYLGRLTEEFWTDTKVDFLKILKGIGEATRGGEFCLFPNTTWWTKGAYEIARVSTVGSFNQSEENGGNTGGNPGLVPADVPGQVSKPTYNRKAFRYKFNQSVSNGMRVCMTTRQGPHRLPDAVRAAISENPQTASLAVAESAAYSGGGAFKMQLPWDSDHAIRRWRAFCSQHLDLYAGGDIWAPVGVIAFAEQYYCGESKEHQEALEALCQPLLEETVLYDMVHEANFTPERLARFRVVVVPAGVRSLDSAQLEIFRGYAGGGGRLLICGDDFASMDEKCRPRATTERTVRGAMGLPAKVTVDALQHRLSEALGRSASNVTGASGKVPPGVGINVFHRTVAGEPEAMLCHLVNYNVPLGEGRKDPPRPVNDLNVVIPLPPRWRPRAVKAFSPDAGENLGVKMIMDRAQVRLRVPQLNLYQAIRLT